jgi:NAD-dependent dihydropyrimidine dehydrogenase PreA subunit
MAYVIDVNSCVACGDCQNNCPIDGAIIPGDTYSVEPSLCIDCGVCADDCLTASIYLPRISQAA